MNTSRGDLINTLMDVQSTCNMALTLFTDPYRDAAIRTLALLVLNDIRGGVSQ